MKYFKSYILNYFFIYNSNLKFVLTHISLRSLCDVILISFGCTSIIFILSLWLLSFSCSFSLCYTFSIRPLATLTPIKCLLVSILIKSFYVVPSVNEVYIYITSVRTIFYNHIFQKNSTFLYWIIFHNISLFFAGYDLYLNTLSVQYHHANHSKHNPRLKQTPAIRWQGLYLHIWGNIYHDVIPQYKIQGTQAIYIRSYPTSQREVNHVLSSGLLCWLL